PAVACLGYANRSYQRLYKLIEYPRARPTSIPANLRARSAVKMLQLSQTAVGTGEYLHNREIPEFHDGWLIGCLKGRICWTVRGSSVSFCCATVGKEKNRNKLPSEEVFGLYHFTFEPVLLPQTRVSPSVPRPQSVGDCYIDQSLSLYDRR